MTLDYERCCVTKMQFTRVCMGTSRICFKYLKFNVLWIKTAKLTYLAFLTYSLLFHGVWNVLKRFQRVSAGGGVADKAGLLNSNHCTVKTKIFTRNDRSLFRSRSVEVYITRFPARRSLVHKSHRNSLIIARLPAQICLSRCYLMRILNGDQWWATRLNRVSNHW